MGRDPLEIQRLATGLWYTGRRDLTSALYTLLRVAYSLIIFLAFFFSFFLLVFLVSSYITIFLVEQAVVLDQGLEPDLIADIQGLLEELIKAGLRQRLITLIKVLTA